MGKIEKFRFHWTDAWGISARGYDSIVEITEDGSIVLRFMVEMEPFSIMLGDREGEFIDTLKSIGLQKISGYNFFDPWVTDGDMWSIDIIGEDIDIYASGDNTFPRELESLLEYLHEEWQLPICEIGKYYYHRSLRKRHIERYGEKTKIDISEERMYNMYSMEE